jgi:hypothetical protein
VGRVADGVGYRLAVADFVVEPSTAGSVFVHAETSAQALEVALERKLHAFAVIAELQVAGALPAIDPLTQGGINADDEQLRAAARDLHELAAQAAQQRSDPSKPLPTISLTYENRMPTPDPSDTTRVTATVVAMNNLLAGAFRDTADRLEMLVRCLRRGKVSTEVLAFATEMEQLAARIQPTGMPPGPHAPRP